MTSYAYNIMLHVGLNVILPGTYGRPIYRPTYGRPIYVRQAYSIQKPDWKKCLQKLCRKTADKELNTKLLPTCGLCEDGGHFATAVRYVFVLVYLLIYLSVHFTCVICSVTNLLWTALFLYFFCRWDEFCHVTREVRPVKLVLGYTRKNFAPAHLVSSNFFHILCTLAAKLHLL